MQWRSSRRYWIVGCLVGLAFTMVAFHERLLPVALQWLDVGEPPRSADAIMVLLGDADVRPFVGAALYRAGFASKVLLGIHDDPHNRGNSYWPPRHVVNKAVLLHRGVPESDIILLGSGANSTKDEIQALGEYLAQRPEEQVLLVTTHFHTRRSRWTIRRLIPQHAARIHLVSAPDDEFSADDWWKSELGFEYIVMEYIKLVAYWFFYGHGLFVSVSVGAVATLAWILRKRQMASLGRCENK